MHLTYQRHIEHSISCGPALPRWVPKGSSGASIWPELHLGETIKRRRSPHVSLGKDVRSAGRDFEQGKSEGKNGLRSFYRTATSRTDSGAGRIDPPVIVLASS